jgi:hypothetical protein
MIEPSASRRRIAGRLNTWPKLWFLFLVFESTVIRLALVRTEIPHKPQRKRPKVTKVFRCELQEWSEMRADEGHDNTRMSAVPFYLSSGTRPGLEEFRITNFGLQI